MFGNATLFYLHLQTHPGQSVQIISFIFLKDVLLFSHNYTEQPLIAICPDIKELAAPRSILNCSEIAF